MCGIQTVPSGGDKLHSLDIFQQNTTSLRRMLVPTENSIQTLM
jgi:hypothetical protein